MGRIPNVHVCERDCKHEAQSRINTSLLSSSDLDKEIKLMVGDNAK